MPSDRSPHISRDRDCIRQPPATPIPILARILALSARSWESPSDPRPAPWTASRQTTHPPLVIGSGCRAFVKTSASAARLRTSWRMPAKPCAVRRQVGQVAMLGGWRDLRRLPKKITSVAPLFRNARLLPPLRRAKERHLFCGQDARLTRAGTCLQIPFSSSGRLDEALPVRHHRACAHWTFRRQYGGEVLGKGANVGVQLWPQLGIPDSAGKREARMNANSLLILPGCAGACFLQFKRAGGHTLSIARAVLQQGQFEAMTQLVVSSQHRWTTCACLHTEATRQSLRKEPPHIKIAMPKPSYRDAQNKVEKRANTKAKA